MFKFLFKINALLLVVFLFEGCVPELQSMGMNAMPVYHEPRWNDSLQSRTSITLGAMGGVYGEGLNIQEVTSGGADIAFMHRFGGSFNPLFIQASVIGMSGRLKFTCSDDDCIKEYDEWLDSKEGREKYSFWNVQEHLFFGSDFLTTKVIQLGFGIGLQLYQSSGDYESKRLDLEDDKYVSNINDKNDWNPIYGYWIGFVLGPKAGVIRMEMTTLLKTKIDESVSNIGLVYFHPTGFFGGLNMNSQYGPMMQIGKTFSF